MNGMTVAELHQLRLRAKAGDQVAQHMLSTLDQLNAGGVPIGPGRQAPPGMKMVNLKDLKKHPLPCGACGSTLFEKIRPMESFYDENDPSHQWLGLPVEKTLCAKCGSELVITEIRRQSDDPKEPEVRYEYSTRTFRVGIQQIQQILSEQRVQMMNQMAEIIDEYFGKEREPEANDLALRMATAFGLKQDAEEPVPASPVATKPDDAPKSSIITEL
jgi:ribosomal protein S27AE